MPRSWRAPSDPSPHKAPARDTTKVYHRASESSSQLRSLYSGTGWRRSCNAQSMARMAEGVRTGHRLGFIPRAGTILGWRVSSVSHGVDVRKIQFDSSIVYHRLFEIVCAHSAATAVWGGAKSCEGLSNDAKAGEEGVRASEKMAPRARLRGCEGGMGAERCGAAQAPPAAQVVQRTVAPRPRTRGAPLSPSRRRVVGRGLSKGPRLRSA